MKNRIFGLETEYGLLVNTDSPDTPSPWIPHKIIDHLFQEKKHGVLGRHYRGYDEPPGNGGFLLNAGRMYVDMGHVEYASPECHSLWDLLSVDRAGDAILQDCLEEHAFYRYADPLADVIINIVEDGDGFPCDSGLCDRWDLCINISRDTVSFTDGAGAMTHSSRRWTRHDRSGAIRR